MGRSTAVPARPEAVPAAKVGAFMGLIVNARDLVPVPPAFVALKVTFVILAVVGVPEIRPDPVLIDSPAGKLVALKLVGLLVAVI